MLWRLDPVSNTHNTSFTLHFVVMPLFRKQMHNIIVLFGCCNINCVACVVVNRRDTMNSTNYHIFKSINVFISYDFEHECFSSFHITILLNIVLLRLILRSPSIFTIRKCHHRSELNVIPIIQHTRQGK